MTEKVADICSSFAKLCTALLHEDVGQASKILGYGKKGERALSLGELCCWRRYREQKSGSRRICLLLMTKTSEDNPELEWLNHPNLTESFQEFASDFFIHEAADTIHSSWPTTHTTGHQVATRPRVVHCQLDFGNNTRLQTAFLPASQLWQTNAMPKYNACEKLPSAATPSYNADDVVGIFLSHRWLQKDHPDDNENGDWMQLRGFIQDCIKGCLETYRILESLQYETRIPSDNDAVLLLPAGKEPSVLLLSYRLIHHIYQIVCRAVQQNSPDSTNDEILQWVADRIYLWIDFCCLPQSPRKDEEEEDWFRASLKRLDSIQRQMHTLILTRDDSSKKEYLSRAWCMAEAGCADRTFTTMYFSSDDRYVFFRADTIRVMIGTEAIHPADVLESLQLNITNGKEDSTTVCNILWSTAMKEALANDVAIFFGRELVSRSPPFVRVMGRQGTVVSYFRSIASLDKDNPPSFEWWQEWRRQFMEDRNTKGDVNLIHSFVFYVQAAISWTLLFQQYAASIEQKTQHSEDWIDCYFDEESQEKQVEDSTAFPPDALKISMDDAGLVKTWR